MRLPKHFLLLVSLLTFTWLDKARCTVNICGIALDIGSTTVVDSSNILGSGCGTLPAGIANLTSVHSINLQGKGFTGPLPTELGDLSLLTLLNLEQNAFTGQIPSEIGRLAMLSRLALDENVLTGNVPAELGNLTSLTFLGVARNMLQGEILPQIEKLANLEFAFLFENAFTGTIGPAIGDLSSLTELQLRVNDFTGSVPPEIGKLENLKVLDIERNRLTGRLPSTLGDLSALEELDLNRNQFSGQIPKEITTLAMLEKLFMQGNRLTGSLPSELGDLSLLKELVAHENLFDSTLPTELGRLLDLKFLQLQGNRFSGSVPSQIGNLVLLDGLNLENNLFDGRIPNTFQNLVALTSLRLGSVLCDCELLSFYSTFLAGLSVANKFNIATCSTANIYDGLSPHILIRDADAPCSHPNFVNKTVFGPREAEVAWSYPFLAEIPNIAKPNVSLSTWDDGQVAIAAEEVIPLFHACSREFRASTSTFAGQQHFAFRISWKEANSMSQVGEIRCEFAEDLEITGGYEFTIPNLLPDVDYQVTVTPIFVEFALFREPNYVIGPESQVFQLRTGQDAPDSAPLNLDTSSRDSDRIDLIWEEPLQANGAVSYAIDCSCSQTRVSERTSTSFAGLLPSTEYTFTVTPFTASGAGPNATLTVKTCQPDTRANAKTDDTCFALPGYFLAEDGVTARPCAEFAEEIVVNVCFDTASDLGVNASRLLMQEGFWRTSSDSSDFRPCPLAGACVGGIADDLCRANYTGPLCAVCEQGFFLNGQVCESCVEPDVSGFGPLIAFFVVLIAAVFVLKVYAWKKQITAFEALETMGTKAKVLLTTYQIVSAFTWSLGVAFPEAYSQLLSILFFITLDVTEVVLPLGCALELTYLGELAIVLCLPLFVFIPGFLRLLYSWRKMRLGESSYRKTFNTWVQVLILTSIVVYAPVTNKVFRAFRPCEEFDTGKAFLPDDFRIECSSPEYDLLQTIAILGCTLYSALIPMVYIGLLCSRKDAIQNEIKTTSSPRQLALEQEEGEPDYLLENIGWLYKSYVWWWWEILETVRKLVLTGVIVRIEPGSPNQSIVLMFLALATSIMYQFFRPFRDESNLLGIVSSYSVVFISFGSLLLKFNRDFDYFDENVVDGVLVLALAAPVVVAVLWSKCCVGKRLCAKLIGKSEVESLREKNVELEEELRELRNLNQNTPLKKVEV